MSRELMEAYADVLGGSAERVLVLGTKKVVLKRELAGEKDEFKIESKTKERISVYINGEKQDDSAVVLGVFGIMNLVNSTPTSPTRV